MIIFFIKFVYKMGNKCCKSNEIGIRALNQAPKLSREIPSENEQSLEFNDKILQISFSQNLNKEDNYFMSYNKSILAQTEKKIYILGEKEDLSYDLERVYLSDPSEDLIFSSFVFDNSSRYICAIFHRKLDHIITFFKLKKGLLSFKYSPLKLKRGEGKSNYLNQFNLNKSSNKKANKNQNQNHNIEESKKQLSNLEDKDGLVNDKYLHKKEKNNIEKGNMIDKKEKESEKTTRMIQKSYTLNINFGISNPKEKSKMYPEASPANMSSIENPNSIFKVLCEFTLTTEHVELFYCKMFKNIQEGISDLMVCVFGAIIFVIFNKKTIISTNPQICSKVALDCDYYKDHYYVLFPGNNITIFKRINEKPYIEELSSHEILLPIKIKIFKAQKILIPVYKLSSRECLNILPKFVKNMFFAGKTKYGDKFYPSIYKYDFQNKCPVKISIIDSSADITSLAFGPFDNGPLCVSLTDGKVLILNVFTLKRLTSIQASDSIIENIAMIPMQSLIFSSLNQLSIFSITPSQFIYRYEKDEENDTIVKTISKNELSDPIHGKNKH